MIRTPICELLGIEKPLFQGGMAWIADASLAAAVSEAGGLGIISAMNAGPDWVREQIRDVRTRTQRPFGVNVMLQSPFAAEVADVVAEERVPVVVTGAGNPSKYLRAWKAAGVKVIPVVSSVALARLLERAGADAIVAEGGESGGHVGDLSTMVLVPQVVDAVKVPVLAAGGIADGRQVAAAFMLGAQGVQVGTRFLVAKECTVSQEYKDRIIKAKDLSTIVTGRSINGAVRCLTPPFSQEFARRERAGATAEELASFGAGSLRKAAKEGNYQEGSFMAGEVAAMVHQEQTAAQIVDDLMDGAERCLKRATAWVC